MPVKPNAAVPHLHLSTAAPNKIELLVNFGLGHVVSLNLGTVLQDSTELSLSTTFVQTKLNNSKMNATIAGRMEFEPVCSSQKQTQTHTHTHTHTHTRTHIQRRKTQQRMEL